jgi:hypothetical protein
MKQNDRYLIYKMLGRYVRVYLPERFGGRCVNGVVERVCRDIFDNSVEVTLDGTRHTFREPESIVLDEGGDIHFIYGDGAMVDESGGVFKGDYNGYVESINDHLARTSSRPVSRTTFYVGEIVKSPSARWRTRAAVS